MGNPHLDKSVQPFGIEFEHSQLRPHSPKWTDTSSSRRSFDRLVFLKLSPGGEGHELPAENACID